MRPLFTIITAISLGVAPSVWRALANSGVPSPADEVERPAPSFAPRPAPSFGKATVLQETPQSLEERQLLTENDFKKSFATAVSLADSLQGKELDIGWRASPSEATITKMKRTDPDWMTYPVSAFQALVEFESNLIGDAAYREEINGAIRCCLCYRRPMLYEHFSQFDPYIQNLLRPVLEPGSTDRTVEELMRDATDYYCNLDVRWTAVRALYPRSGGTAQQMTADGDEALISIAASEMISGLTLQDVERKLAALTEEAQSKTMTTMMKIINRDSPYELSNYLQSLPRNASWRAAGIQMLLQSLDPDSGEAKAWSTELHEH